MDQTKDTTSRRALLTDRERDIIAENVNVSNAYRYQTISRIRRRFKRLEGDIDALKSHGGLLDEFQQAVCDDNA